MDNSNSNAKKDKILVLKNMIFSNFPDNKYCDLLFPGDEPELDEARDLYHGLNSLKWTDVPKEFICANPSQISLLRGSDFMAFFPAWLLQSIEDPNKKNDVREYVTYLFSPSNATHENHYLQQMNSLQRSTVSAILNFIAENEQSKFIKDHAINAVKFISEYEKNLKSGAYAGSH